MSFYCIDCGRWFGPPEDDYEPTICEDCRRKRVSAEVTHNDGRFLPGGEEGDCRGLAT